MFFFPEEVNHNTASTEREKYEKSDSKSQQCLMTSRYPTFQALPSSTGTTSSNEQGYLLRAVIESFVDGILILTTQREFLHANECARRICRQLMQGTVSNSVIPQEIWRVCESLIDSSDLYPEERIFIESEVDIDTKVKLRIRARWLQLSTSDRNFLLVTLEDRNQTSQGMALADAKRYGLTDREAEVWILRRSNFSYKEIAAKLYITINTVKKHLKNIYAKQQDMLWS